MWPAPSPRSGRKSFPAAATRSRHKGSRGGDLPAPSAPPTVKPLTDYFSPPGPNKASGGRRPELRLWCPSICSTKAVPYSRRIRQSSDLIPANRLNFILLVLCVSLRLCSKLRYWLIPSLGTQVEAAKPGRACPRLPHVTRQHFGRPRSPPIRASSLDSRLLADLPLTKTDGFDQKGPG